MFQLIYTLTFIPLLCHQFPLDLQSLQLADVGAKLSFTPRPPVQGRFDDIGDHIIGLLFHFLCENR